MYRFTLAAVILMGCMETADAQLFRRGGGCGNPGCVMCYGYRSAPT